MCIAECVPYTGRPRAHQRTVTSLASVCRLKLELEKKLPSIEVGVQTDRISLTYDLALKSTASYGHDLLTCKSSKSTVSWLPR